MVAPGGTVTTIFVGESRVIAAEVPLKVTAVAPSRPLPRIVTVAATTPFDGEKPSIVGTIVNVAALVAVPKAVTTSTVPIVALVGTTAEIDVGERRSKCAFPSPNKTFFTRAKLPVIVTVVPAGPACRLKSV